MKILRKNFHRMDIQVTGILCGFHTLWFALACVYAGSDGEGRQILGTAAVLWIFLCLLSAGISYRLFGRISNPGKKELWAIDLMTQLRNRNAFEVDMHNLEGKRAGCALGIIVIDLDHLKKINDVKGHAMGDVYIYDAAKSIREELGENAVAYRIGGDEFVILIFRPEETEMENLILRIQRRFDLHYGQDLGEDLFLSAGYAIYNQQTDEKFVDTLIRADENMYKEKKDRREKSIQKMPL